MRQGLSKWGRALAVAATYIGAVVGAGFASGSEILHFFNYHGPQGLFGVILAAGGFALVGYCILESVRAAGARNYRDFLNTVFGPHLTVILDGILTFYLAGGLAVVLAGGGAVFYQQWNLPYNLGVWVMAAGVTAVVLGGAGGVLSANLVLVPMLLMVVVATGVMALRGARLSDLVSLAGGELPLPSGGWALSALLYVAYNSLLALGILASTGRELSGRRASMLAGFLGGLGLGACGLLIALANHYHFQAVKTLPVPMLFIASVWGKHMAQVYSFALLVAMLTTGITNAYSLGRRLAGDRGNARLWAGATVLFVTPFARLGFTTLIRTVYPLMGYLGLGFVTWILIHCLRHPGRSRAG